MTHRTKLSDAYGWLRLRALFCQWVEVGSFIYVMQLEESDLNCADLILRMG